jgi:hypothetical protein
MRASEELLAAQHAENTRTIGARGVSVGKYEVVLSPDEGVRQEDSLSGAANDYFGVIPL